MTNTRRGFFGLVAGAVAAAFTRKPKPEPLKVIGSGGVYSTPGLIYHGNECIVPLKEGASQEVAIQMYIDGRQVAEHVVRQLRAEGQRQRFRL